MKKRIVSLLLALALLVLPVLPAFAAEEDPYTYVALGDSITTGVGLKDTHFSSTAKSYDVQENYHGYSKDCYVARVADALGLDRDHAVNYGMPAAMSSNILDLVRTGSTASGVAYYDLPTLRQELADAHGKQKPLRHAHRAIRNQPRPQAGVLEHEPSHELRRVQKILLP